jgi:cell division protein FtsI/penicillin-binding protein 2
MIARLIRLGWRQLLVFLLLFSFAGFVGKGLVYWQVVEHARITREAARIYGSQTNLPAQRGAVVDTSGMALVGDTASWLVAADPQYTPQPSYAAAKLSHVLNRDPGPILSLLKTPYTRYVVIARQVDDATAHNIRALKLQGIILTQTHRPVYPGGQLAAQVLGFVNYDGTGQYGVEEQYDNILAGKDGSQFAFVDTANQPLPVGIARPRPPVDGATLQLTIDARIQSILERRLAAAVQQYGAESANGVIMDPHTGAILAMASVPGFDPNHYGDYFATSSTPDVFNNLTLRRYQPGSTFKVISVSAGLDSGAFTPQTTVYDPGYFTTYNGVTIRNWDTGNGWGVETPEIMLRHSANVGMVQFAGKMNPLTYYRYLIDRFGFGSPTGVDLPGESAGAVRTPDHGPWQLLDLYTNSYGQGIDVTPLQLTDAVAALANGGWRMKPYVVKSITYPDHSHAGWYARPQRVTRAVKPSTAATMTGLLVKSAVDGEATCALTAGVPVAAKTGTATIDQPGAHGQSFTSGTVASLIGYAPANNPRFVMLIVIRHPQPGPIGNDIWGSVVAAPAWHDVALSLYRLMNIVPQPGSTPDTLGKLQGPTDWDCAFMPQ